MVPQSEPQLEPLTDRAADAVLFRMPHRAVSAGEFVADAAAVAARLPRADMVANLCQDRYRFAVLFAACVLSGRTCLLTGDQSERGLARLRERFPGLEFRDDSAAQPSGAPAAPASWPPPALPASRLAAIVLTSGSTGEPNAVPKLWGELVARSRAIAQGFGLATQGAPEVIGTTPPHHMYGFETTVLLPLHSRTASWCGPVFYPADLRRALARVPGGRILVTTPVHLRVLLESEPPLERPPEQVISATAPLDVSLAAHAETQWGARVLEIFGATEVGSVATRRTVSDESWTLLPGLSLLPPDEAPRIEAPHAPATPLADTIERAPDGRSFRLLGRSNDLVKLGGRRASLAGLTRALLGLEGVTDGIFLAPDDLAERPGARLIAFAVAPGCSAAVLLDALRREIDPLFMPRRLMLCEALPRNQAGKLPRQALLDLLARQGVSGDADG